MTYTVSICRNATCGFMSLKGDEKLTRTIGINNNNNIARHFADETVGTRSA